MAKQTANLNSEVNIFLDELNHPFRKGIEQLRNYILTANSELIENNELPRGRAIEVSIGRK